MACVECHIGPGAPWFVKAKISGVRQLFAVALKTYSRPIPSPVHDLRPARDTCEHCHWPQKFTGDKFLVRTKYADDEKNTPSTSVLLLKIGGRTAQGLVGIHGRHLDDAERIEYVSTDGRRQVIPLVTYTDDAGKKIEYVSTEIEADDRAARQRRAPQDGLHGLPQPADPRLRDAGAGRRRGHDRRAASARSCPSSSARPSRP